MQTSLRGANYNKYCTVQLRVVFTSFIDIPALVRKLMVGRNVWKGKRDPEAGPLWFAWN